MKLIFRLASYTAAITGIVGLAFASGFLGIMIYAKATGRELLIPGLASEAFAAKAELPKPKPTVSPTSLSSATKAPAKPATVMLKAPAIMQKPELPSGCEVTSLAMLLQFAGIDVSKMELAAAMKVDPTPIKRAEDGTIQYWGNPNMGFVGDVTGRSRGFGIYHGALLDLMHKYLPGGIDLTGQSFDKLEGKLAEGYPVIAWTTIDYSVPDRWLTWDTPIGPIQTTFMEHAVLLVGYDADNVYANDPWTGAAQFKIDKKQFITVWEAMGKQALSYSNSKG